MKSKITLYYKSLVNKEKNFVLDNPDGILAIETYLATLTSESINEFQYVKQGLSVSIKINKNQVALEMIDSKDLNYVKIQNYDVVNNVEVLEKAYYYFVISKNWKAKESVELVLSMDTLNTFRFNNDYKLNSKTLVKRMHKDRFNKVITQVHLSTDYDVSPIFPVNLTNMNHFGNLFIAIGEDDVRVFEVEFAFRITPIASRGFHIYNVKKELSDFLFKYKDDASVHFQSIFFEGTHYQFSDEPNISLITPTIAVIRNIDLKSEDIIAPVYKKKEDTLYEQEGDFTNSWVLYYKNKTNQDNSPVDCFLTSDTELTFLTETGSNTISANDITEGTEFFLTPPMSGDVLINVDGANYRVYEQTNTSTYWCVGIKKENSVLSVTYYKYGELSVPPRVHLIGIVASVVNPTTIEILSSIDELHGREITPPPANEYYFSNPSSPFNPLGFNKTLVLVPLEERVLAPSSTIDKTLSENLKIINIPYCPSQIENQNNSYTIEPLWKYDSTLKFFKLEDLSYRFSNIVTTSFEDVISVYNPALTPSLVDVNKTRYLDDSKLFHSDYYRYKFVYDSFTRIFPLEQINYIESKYLNPDGKFKFTFIMSRNIVSKFLFQFNYIYKSANEDYPNIVAVARNNEEVLYNSSYLNYIRTGYNYDLKSKERQETAGAVGLGLNIAGLLASIGLSFIPGGQAIGIAGAVGAGLGLAGQIVNYAKTTAQNEENIQRKLQETQRQGVSVLNADDYDLLYAYTQNKAKLCLYEVSDNMKNVLNDLFYYCGYVVNEQFIPSSYTRYWFNFIQAGLIIEDSSNLTSEIEDDIKEKFEQGVTFLHYHQGTTIFDLEQEKENWETSLL